MTIVGKQGASAAIAVRTGGDSAEERLDVDPGEAAGSQRKHEVARESGTGWKTHAAARRRFVPRRRCAPISATSGREIHAEFDQADPLESFLAEQAAARRRIFEETLGDELAAIFEELEAELDLDDEQLTRASYPPRSRCP